MTVSVAEDGEYHMLLRAAYGQGTVLSLKETPRKISDKEEQLLSPLHEQTKRHQRSGQHSSSRQHSEPRF